MKHIKGRGARVADDAWRIRYEAIMAEELSPEEESKTQASVLSKLQEAVEISKTETNLLDLSYSLSKYAQIHGYIHGPEAAFKIYVESAEAARQGGSPFLEGHALRHLADKFCDLKYYERAEPLYERALELLRSDPETDTLSMGNILRPQAILFEETGRLELAAQRWRDARVAYEKVGIQEGVVECDAHLKDIASKLDA